MKRTSPPAAFSAVNHFLGSLERHGRVLRAVKDPGWNRLHPWSLPQTLRPPQMGTAAREQVRIGVCQAPTNRTLPCSNRSRRSWTYQCDGFSTISLISACSVSMDHQTSLRALRRNDHEGKVPPPERSTSAGPCTFTISRSSPRSPAPWKNKEQRPFLVVYRHRKAGGISGISSRWALPLSITKRCATCRSPDWASQGAKRSISKQQTR